MSQPTQEEATNPIVSPAQPPRRLGHVILSILGTNVFVLVLNFLSGSFLAHQLGPEGRGRLSTMQVWIVLLYWWCSGGFHAAIIHFTAKDTSSRGTVLGNLLVIGGIVGTLTTLVGVGATLWLIPLQQADRVTLLLAFCTMPLHCVLDLSAATMNGLGRLDIRNRIRFWQNLVALLALLWVGLVGHLTPPIALWCIWLTTWVGWGGVYRVLKANAMWRFQVSWPLLREWFRYSVPCLMTTWMTTGLLRIDQMLLTLFVGDKQRGLYVMGVTLSEMLLHLPGAVSLVLFPNSSQSDIEATEKVETCARFVRLTIVGVVAGGLLGIVLLPSAVPLLFGPKFLGSLSIYELLLPGTLAFAIASPIIALFQGQAKLWAVVVPQMVSLLIGVPMLLLSLRYGGIQGAAVASSITYILLCIGLLILLTRQEGWKTTRTFFPTGQMFTNGELSLRRLTGR